MFIPFGLPCNVLPFPFLDFPRRRPADFALTGILLPRQK